MEGAVHGTSAADVETVGARANVNATGLPSNVDAPRAGATVDDLEAVVGRAAATVAEGGSGPDLQRAPSHPQQDIVNVVICADLFLQYLGVLEADLERCTMPEGHRDLVRNELAALKSKAAAVFQQQLRSRAAARRWRSSPTRACINASSTRDVS
jgi:hypothetical protein